MQITFDNDKRGKTLDERGLDFAHAGTIFEGPHFTILDDRRDYGEVRYQTLGRIGDVVIMLVWTERANTRRIISMRRCHADERRDFFQQLERSR